MGSNCAEMSLTTSLWRASPREVLDFPERPVEVSRIWRILFSKISGLNIMTNEFHNPPRRIMDRAALDSGFSMNLFDVGNFQDGKVVDSSARKNVSVFTLTDRRLNAEQDNPGRIPLDQAKSEVNVDHKDVFLDDK